MSFLDKLRPQKSSVESSSAKISSSDSLQGVSRQSQPEGWQGDMQDIPQFDSKVQVDQRFFSQVCPQGGLSFRDEKYIKTGDGYEACIYVYQYPTGVPENWLATLMNVRNAVITVDISNEDMNKVRQYVNKSVKEHRSRLNASKQATESQDSSSRISEMQNLYYAISEMGEIVKLICVRIFVCGRTLQEVDKVVEDTLVSLEANGYKAFVNLNESEADWLSMYRTYKEQQLTPYKRYGQVMTTETLAGGNPFHFTSLSDNYGSYFGWTETRGTVLLDWFQHTSSRTSYNGTIVGDMGSGKSTFLKKLMKDRAVRGDYIRVFDVADEYDTLTESLGGSTISLDGSGGVLNALEVLQTAEEDELCWAQHVTKLTTMYRLLSPSSDDKEVHAFESLLREFYLELGFFDADDQETILKMTGLPPEEYPTWSDFLQFIEGIIEEAHDQDDYVKNSLKKSEIGYYNNVRIVLQNLVMNYGYMFNGYTSIPDILNTQIVRFDIKNLKNMATEIFDAQVFLAQHLWWDNCVRIGAREKALVEQNEKSEEEVIHFLGIIDEAHNMINANKTVTLKQVLVFCREARKYFGGLVFASQSIRDFVPEGASGDSVEDIKRLFELCQYKFIMRQDANSSSLLNNVFGGQVTESEINDIPHLVQGEAILSIQGDRNIRFHVFVTDEELARFKGGV